MALGTDSIAARGRKRRWVHHLGLAFDVQRTGPVAALTSDPVLVKSGIGIGIQRALAPASLAGMAEEAGGLDGPAPAGGGIGRVAGGDVPRTGLRVPSDRGL